MDVVVWCGCGGLVWMWWFGVEMMVWCGSDGLVWKRWFGVETMVFYGCKVLTTSNHL